MKYRGQTVIVTGAGQGIGQAVAAAYAAEGANVVIAELQEQAGRTAAAEIVRLGGNALYIPCDVSREEQVVKLVAETARTYGTVNIVINNAGIANPHIASFYELSVDQWDKVLNTNARSGQGDEAESGRRCGRSYLLD